MRTALKKESFQLALKRIQEEAPCFNPEFLLTRAIHYLKLYIHNGGKILDINGRLLTVDIVETMENDIFALWSILPDDHEKRLTEAAINLETKNQLRFLKEIPWQLFNKGLDENFKSFFYIALDHHLAAEWSIESISDEKDYNTIWQSMSPDEKKIILATAKEVFLKIKEKEEEEKLSWNTINDKAQLIFSTCILNLIPEITDIEKHWNSLPIEQRKILLDKIEAKKEEEKPLKKKTSFFSTSSWYESNQIEKLLKHYLAESDIDYLTPLSAETRFKTHNEFFNALSQYHEQRKKELDIKKQVEKNNILVPIHANSHWVLLQLIYNPKDELPYSIIYYDPKGREIPESIDMTLTTMISEKNFHPEIFMSYTPLQSSMDSYNCGPWIIEIAKIINEQDRDHKKVLDFLFELAQRPDLDSYIETARKEHQKILTEEKSAKAEDTAKAGHEKPSAHSL